MFLNFLDTKDGRTVSKLARESTTYNAYYKYWRDQLFERIMRLFVWEGTGEVPPKEIELRLLLQGHCGIAKYGGELTAFFGTFWGPTKYQDEWTNYTVRCPLYSGQKTIGKDIVVIDNNKLRNPTYELVHHYATLLSHCEVTLNNIMINARDAGGIPIASTEKQKVSIKQYQGKLYNGQFDVVSDIGMLGVDYAGSDRRTNQNVMDIMIIRERLLKSFYSDIGVRSAFEKRSNSVEAEVEADTSLLLLNLSDMIDSREKGCDLVNLMYGTNWSVRIADEIDYGTENERLDVENNEEVSDAENDTSA